MSNQQIHSPSAVITRAEIKSVEGAKTVALSQGKVKVTHPTVILTVTPTLVPKPINFGIVVDDYANKNGALSSVTSELHHTITTVSIYKQFSSQYNSMLNLDDLAYIKTNNIHLLIAWEPWDPTQGNSQSTDYLKQIAQGQQDSYLRSFAESVKSYASPVTIRFGHEMNTNTYPWGNRPADYIAAYRYIVQFFRNDSVQNVTWMWSINSDNVPYTPMSDVEAYYPGNDVVDIIGIDGFNFGSTNSTGWRSFTQIFQPAYSFVTRTYAKPVIISEVASAEAGGDKSAWVANMFSSLPVTFPGISEIIWFDLLKETDWRLDSTPSTLKAFQTYL